MNDRQELAAGRRRHVWRLARLGLADRDIAKAAGISKRHVQAIRLKAGIGSREPAPVLGPTFARGWAAAGLRTSNLSEVRVAALYGGERYA